MSNRIAVFNEGRIEQVAEPTELYEHPDNAFVAGFVGVSNLLERDGKRFTVRPEKVLLIENGSGPRGIHSEPGVVREVAYAGMVTRYIVELDAGESFRSSARTWRRRQRTSRPSAAGK